MDTKPLLHYDVSARRIDAHDSAAVCKDANIVLDTDVAGTIYNTVASATNLSGTIRRGGAGD